MPTLKMPPVVNAKSKSTSVEEKRKWPIIRLTDKMMPSGKPNLIMFVATIWALEVCCFLSIISLVRNYRPVCVGPAVAKKLPRVAHLTDLVHIKVGDDKLVLVA